MVKPSNPLHLYVVCEGVSCLYECVGTMCVPGACGGRRRAMGLLELELRVVVSLHVGAGNPTWVL